MALKRRPLGPRPRIALAAAAAAALGGVLWWGSGIGRRRPAPEIPAEFLFPPNVSAAVRVSGFRSAFSRHWALRGNRAEDEAIQRLLAAFGLWERWSVQYGERGARARMLAYKSALFELLGAETWLVFGEWAAPGLEGTGEVALLVFTTEDSLLKSRIGPLAELLFPGHRIRSTDYRGVEILEYLDTEQRRAITTTHLGGWLCASLRSPGREPLIEVIDQYHDRLRTDRGAELFFAPPGGSTPSALTALFRPQLFWAHYRQFAVKRGQPLDEKRENRIVSWTQRLESIDEIRITQNGPSLLDLDLDLRGPRVANLASVLVDGRSLDLEPPGSFGARRPPALSPSMLQADFSYPFALEGLPLFGLDWEVLLDELDNVRWFAPRVVRVLDSLLQTEDAPADGRFGLALYPTTRSALPIVSVWEDFAPLAFDSQSPADAWRLVGTEAAESRGDSMYITGIAVYDGSTTSTLARAQRRLADELWHDPGSPPAAFVTIHFDELVAWMSDFPVFLLSKSDRPRWVEYRSIAQGFQLAAGSAALRLDRSGQRLTLRLRTLHLDAAE